jgi:hypothetical protein
MALNKKNIPTSDNSIERFWVFSHHLDEIPVLELNHYTNFQPLCSYTNRYIKKDN